MCLILNNKQVTKQIAQEDIIVYKRLVPTHHTEIPGVLSTKVHKSPYFNFKYVLGRLYTSKLAKPEYRDHDSWHAYTSKYLVFQGFHAYIRYRDAYNAMYREEEIYECIIPKGAEYYSNQLEIASNQMKIIKKLHTYVP